MAVMKKVSIKNASGTGYDSRDIGAEAQNIDVSYDANGKIIEDISSATVSSTKSLAKALKNIDVDDLANTTISNPSNGQGLIYNGSKWVNKDIEAGSSSLSALTDTTISSPSNGQGLVYNGSKWVNKNIETGSAVNTLNDLTDTTISNPSSGQGLIYNGSKWINGSLAKNLNDISDVSISGVSSGQVLTYNGGRWINMTPSASDKMDKDGSNADSSVSMSSTTSFRIGPSNTANSYSQAMGSNNVANGSYSQAMGYGTRTYGIYSHAEGQSTCAVGSHAHAEGLNTCAGGIQSHAEGTGTTADGQCSHAEGYYTKVNEISGYISGGHAEGMGTCVYGQCSHAEGYYTCATGGSHTEGARTCAPYSYCHVGGVASKSATSEEFVFGLNVHKDITNPTAYYTGQGMWENHEPNACSYMQWDSLDGRIHEFVEDVYATIGHGGTEPFSQGGATQGVVSITSNGNIYSTGMRFKTRGVVEGTKVADTSTKVYIPKGSVYWLIANSYTLNNDGTYRGTNSYLITTNGGGASTTALAVPKAVSFGASSSSGITLKLGADTYFDEKTAYTNGTYCGYVEIGASATNVCAEYAFIPILTPISEFATKY